MTTHEVLKEARALIRKGWCQGAWARSADGKSVPPNSRKATRYCAFGAVMHAAKRSGLEWHAIAALTNAIFPCSSATRWNDSTERTKADVLTAFDKAIEAQSR